MISKLNSNLNYEIYESSKEYLDEDSINNKSLTDFQKKVNYLENNLDLGISWGTQVEEWFGENEYIYYYHCSFNLNYVRKQIYSLL